MEEEFNQLVAFFVGALASFLALIRFDRWWSKRRYKEYGTLVGTWIEANTVLTDRPFSICSFFFSDSDGKLKLTGESFDNQANVFYRWWSVILHIDDRTRRMSYIYETQRIGDRKKDDGFGCYTLNYNTTKRRWEIPGGYFQDLDEAKPRFCKMIRFDEVTSYLKREVDPSSEADQRFVISELLNLKDDPGIRTLFGENNRVNQSGDNHG